MRIRDFVTCGCICVALGAPCYADLVTRWTFNSPTPDSNTGTGTTTPSIGSGTASLIGGTTATFNSGATEGGSSDPATADDSGWGVTTFPAQGTANETAGVQFTASTVGFENITFSFDTRNSGSASRFMSVYYTTDGTTYNRFAVNSGNANPGMTPASGGSPNNTAGLFGGNGTFSAFDPSISVGDDWFNGRIVDLSSIPGANNNPNFGFRLVSSFGSGTTYLNSGGSGYNTAGTWRFDFVTVSGSAIQAVPEANVFVFGMLGCGLAGLVYARRKLMARKSAE
jgi:hypothetical protein